MVDVALWIVSVLRTYLQVRCRRHKERGVGEVVVMILES